jgi:hypothetical protein
VDTYSLDRELVELNELGVYVWFHLSRSPPQFLPLLPPCHIQNKNKSESLFFKKSLKGMLVCPLFEWHERRAICTSLPRFYSACHALFAGVAPFMQKRGAKYWYFFVQNKKGIDRDGHWLKPSWMVMWLVHVLTWIMAPLVFAMAPCYLLVQGSIDFSVKKIRSTLCEMMRNTFR